MNTIPPDVHERVVELSADITNATLADDDALRQSLYQQLLVYYIELTNEGRCHPFVVEILADYTDDVAESLRYYDQALEMSRQMTSDEPTQTILICIGERLLEMGRREQAEAYLHEGRAEAVRRSDSFWIKEADRLLQDCAN